MFLGASQLLIQDEMVFIERKTRGIWRLFNLNVKMNILELIGGS
jgi:hypothetical protein